MTRKKVTDLKAETNLLNKAIDAIKEQAASLTHSKLAVIVAVLALLITSLLSALAVNSASSAMAMVKYELGATRQELLITKNEMRMLEVFIDQLIDAMKESGIETPEKK